MLEPQTPSWRATWDCDNPAAVRRGCKKARELRNSARGAAPQAAQQVSVDRFHDRVKQLQAKAGTGPDSLRTRDMLRGAPAPKEQLVALLRQSTNQLCLLAQAFLALMTILGESPVGPEPLPC